MSITTKGGDQGTTALLFGRRVSKIHPRVETYGAVDELSACLGMIRAALAPECPEKQLLRQIQSDLISLMAETAVDEADYERWLAKVPTRIEAARIEGLETEIHTREAKAPRFRGFDLAGENELHARCHLARTVCRRAERAFITLRETHRIPVRNELPQYLNRLSDLLWLLGQGSLEAEPSN